MNHMVLLLKCNPYRVFMCVWWFSAVGGYSMSLGNSSNIANGQYSTCLVENKIIKDI